LRESTDPALEERVRVRAHQIWEEEGRPEGRSMEHWIRAVLELARDEGVRLLPRSEPQTDGPAGERANGRVGPGRGS
jgi:hypothetical protein